MTKTARRLRGLLALLFAVLGVAAGTAGAAQDDAPVVGIVRIKGAIDASYAGYLREEIALAEREGFAALVLQLQSSGSVKADVLGVLDAVCEAKVPIAAWVGPRGAAVSGAATELWLAADVGFVAQGAEVRAKVPRERGGEPGVTRGSPCVRKPTDTFSTAAYNSVQDALNRRGGEVGADALVASGFAAGTPGTIVEAVRALDGKVVDGTKLSVDAQATDIRFANPGLIVRVRQALATNPTLVYLLLLTGIAAIVFELFQPGFGPAGYAGGILVALAAYGLVALPISPIALVLLLASVGAMALDVRRNTLGPLTWAGTAVMLVSSRYLVHSHGGALRVPWPTIAFGLVGSLVFYVVVMTVVLRALRGQTADMGDALVGRVGEVRSTLNPQGHVLVEGALWRARALEWDGPVERGTRVTVTGVDTETLVLDVEPVDPRA